MTEVVVRINKNLIQNQNRNKDEHLPSGKECKTTGKVLKTKEIHVTTKAKNRKLLERLAEKAKYNPNYLRETKNLEDIKLKQTYRSYFGLIS